jgi:DNA-directed RNA polymerase specialized sigma24 family protein
VRDPDTVDDLVQEALARVIAVRGRLDDEAVAPYAIVTARNLLTSLPGRRSGAGATGRGRSDPSEPEHPEDAALRQRRRPRSRPPWPGCPTTSGRRWWPTRSRGSTPPPYADITPEP